MSVAITAQLRRIEEKLDQIMEQKIDQELTATQVSKEYGWPVPTVHFWREQGLLEASQKTAGGKYFFRRSSCDKVSQMTKPERKQAVKAIRQANPAVIKSKSKKRKSII